MHRKAFKLVTILSFLILLAGAARSQNSNVSIGTENVKERAILWLKGNGNQGVLLPAVTNRANFTGLNSTDDKGMMIYDLSDNKVYYWNGSTWVEVSAASGVGTVTTISTGAGLTGGPITSSGTISIAPSGVTATELAANAVTTAKINAAAVDNTKIADNAITSTKIATGAVGSDEIADGAVTNADINSGAGIQVSKLAPGTNGQVLSVTGGVASWSTPSTGGSVTNIATGPGLEGGPITSTGTIGIKAGGVTGTELADNAVTNLKILDGTIANADINNAANIQVSKLAPGTNGQVLSVAGGVASWSTPSSGGSVTNIATGAGLEGGPITSTGTIAIKAGGVTGTELADNAVSTAKISANAVDNTKILDGTIANADINNAANIQVSKLAPGTNGQVLSVAGGVASWSTPSSGGSVTNIATGAGLEGGPITSTGTIAIKAGGVTGTELADNAVTTAKLSANAVDNTKILDGTIANADISTTAGIQVSKLAPGTNGQVLSVAGGVASWSAAAAGTVTSITTGTGLTGGPITATGTISIAALGVGTAQIADNAVTNIKIAGNAVTTDKIADGTITGADIGAKTITADKIAQSSASAGQILKWNGTNWVAGDDDTGAGTVPTLNNGQILVGDGTTNGVATVTGDATLSGGTLTLSPEVVTTGKIKDGDILNADISNAAAIQVSKLQTGTNGQVLTVVSGVPAWSAASAGTVTSITTGTGLTGGPITSSGTIAIAPLGVTSAELAANAVTNGKIAANAVTSDKITDATITGADIASATVTHDKIAQGGATNQQVLQWDGLKWVPGTVGTVTSITTGTGLTGGPVTTTGTIGLAPSGVTATELAANAVTSAKILDGTIVNADVAAAAAIDGTKVNPNFGAQNVTTTGSGNFNKLNVVASTGINEGATVTLSTAGATSNIGMKLNVNGSTSTNYGISPTASAGSTAYGVDAKASGATSAGYGVYGTAEGSTPLAYGVFGDAKGTGSNFGVYGTASGGAENFAGYFAGNTVVLGGLAVGASNLYGTAGQVLTSQGSGVAPQWSNPSALGWGLTGNANTTAGTNFIGTTDDQAFEIKVNGVRVVRYELDLTPNTSGTLAPNIIAGFSGNSAAAGIKGSVIGGGGLDNANTVDGDWAVVAGGRDNHAGKTVSPYAAYASVGGGASNNAVAQWATIGGGKNNTANGSGTAIAGGIRLISTAFGCTVAGMANVDPAGLGYSATSWVSTDPVFIVGNGQTSNDGNTVITRSNAMMILKSGITGIGRTPTTNRFEVEGEASKTTAGSWIANSDRRIKTDIQDISNSIALIKRLRPVKFRYTDEWKAKHPSIKDQYYYNFIAQEYANVFPESVQKSGEKLDGQTDEVLQIDTYNAQITSIKALQELIAKVEKLESENTVLREKNEKLESSLQTTITELKDQQESFSKQLEEIKALILSPSSKK